MERMIPYRDLKSKTQRQPSPRKAARAAVRVQIAALASDVVSTLSTVPTKLEQIEALVRAGRMADPLMAASGAASPPQPDPLPRREREKSKSAGEGENASESLTARVRALYENSVVPVREIARLAGVSERTLYKYVRRGGW